MKSIFNKDQIIETCRKLLKIDEAKEDKSLNELYNYQDTIRELRKMIESFNRVDYKLKFHLSDFKIESSYIGSIQFKKNINCNEDSAILTEAEVTQLNDLCEFVPNAKWELIYRGSKDGFTHKSFEKKCYNINNLLTIIKSKENFVFGGFNSVKYKSDEQEFLFSFKNYKNKPFKSKIHNQLATFWSGEKPGLLRFGNKYNCFGCPDIFIAENCNEKADSYTEFPQSYYGNGFQRTDYILTKQSKFLVQELEVYKITENI